MTEHDRPFAAAVPPDSAAAARLAGASFHDCHAIDVPGAPQPALAYFLAAAAATPAWVDRLMVLRNRIARLAGLKDLGRMAAIDRAKDAAAYVPGERIGIFTLLEQTPQEALLGDRDRHLDVVVAVHRQPLPDPARTRVSVTTIVHVHNLLGRLYMLPVTPLHRRIAPAVLATIGRADAAR